MTTILLALITHLTNPTPEPAQVLCCSREAGCSALPSSGFCPEGKIPHQCSDTETCNDDGSACWLECKPLDGGVS